jgi:hypothetical protein
VKDFVRENWKTATACAAGAFLLSLLVGLITRNPFGIVIFRAFLLAVVFAGLGAGLRYVVKRYLPELLTQGATAAAAGGPADDRATRGTRIDIVLPAESPGRTGRYAATAREGRQGEPPGEDAGLEPLPSEDAGLQTDAETAALGELASELAEELPADEGHETAGGPEAEHAMTGPGVEGGEQAAEEELQGGAGASEPGSDLDSLPDISTLEVAEEQGPSAPRGRRATRPGGDSPADALRGSVGGQDPATIARAIRTVLKRDEKG